MLTLSITSLILLLFSSLTASHPHYPFQFTNANITYTTSVTYYQGDLNAGEACSSEAIAVAHGNVTSGICYTAYTYGVAVQALPSTNCSWTLFKGTQSCAASASGVAIEDFPLPAGNESVCVATGVYDGGAHIYASGKLNCC